jgi:hypothetical protein
VFFSLKEFFFTFSFEDSQIFDVGVAVAGFEEIQFFTGREEFALPAAIDLFFFAAFSDLAERGTASFFADFFAAEFYEGAQQVVCFLVVFEFFEGGNVCKGRCDFVDVGAAQFFAQIPRQVGDCSLVARTISAEQTTISDEVFIPRHFKAKIAHPERPSQLPGSGSLQMRPAG